MTEEEKNMPLDKLDQRLNTEQKIEYALRLLDNPGNEDLGDAAYRRLIRQAEAGNLRYVIGYLRAGVVRDPA